MAGLVPFIARRRCHANLAGHRPFPSFNVDRLWDGGVGELLHRFGSLTEADVGDLSVRDSLWRQQGDQVMSCPSLLRNLALLVWTMWCGWVLRRAESSPVGSPTPFAAFRTATVRHHRLCLGPGDRSVAHFVFPKVARHFPKTNRNMFFWLSAAP